MQWGGSLGQIVDPASQLAVEVRSFGSFDSDIPPGLEGAIRPILLEAVAGAVASHPRGVSADPRDLAAVAQAAAAPRLAAMGIQGELTIAAVSVSPEDHARIQAASAQAAMRMRAQRIAAAGPAASGSFAVGAQVLVQWSDGQRYPGMVREVGADQVLVGFAGGATHWVPLQFVTAG